MYWLEIQRFNARGLIYARVIKTTGAYSSQLGRYLKDFSKWHGRGVSDIICCWKGRFLAIELKIKPNGPTHEQREFLADCRKAGGIAFVAYSLEDVKKELLTLDQKGPDANSKELPKTV